MFRGLNRLCLALLFVSLFTSMAAAERYNAEHLLRNLQETGGLPATGIELAATGHHQVRIMYFIPANRRPQERGVERLRNFIRVAQYYFADQMECNGFQRKTFAFETEPDAVTPKINVVQGVESDSFYRENPWQRVGEETQHHGFPAWIPGEIWLVVVEDHVMYPNGSTTTPFAGGANLASGSDPGWVVISSKHLAILDLINLYNTRDYDGLVIPDLGPHQAVQGVTYPEPSGSTISSVASEAFGILMHDLMQGIGVARDYRNDESGRGNINGEGFRGFRGWLAPRRFPEDQARLPHAAAARLNYSRYFNPERTYTENTRPSLLSRVSSSTPVDEGSLPIRFEASDASGLGVALLLDHNGTTLEEMRLRGSSGQFEFRTGQYLPNRENSFFIDVFDVQGNLRQISFATVPTQVSNRAPWATIQALPISSLPGETITLDASSSFDPDGAEEDLVVEWDLDGDMIFDTVATQELQMVHRYSYPGQYQVSARLTDAAGARTVSAPIAIRVSGPRTAAESWHEYK